MKEFVEKPSPDETGSNLVNAGMYVLERTVLDRTDWLIGNSRATCELFARDNRTLYVPNAVTVEDFEMRNLFGNTIKFGIVSSNIPKKGIADFVEEIGRAHV